MMRSTLLLASALGLLATASPAAAQSLGGDSAGSRLDGNAVDALARQQRIAVTGTLGFPPLPAVTADTPRNTIFYADRMPYGGTVPGGEVLEATKTSFAIPKEVTGTGFAEFVVYQLPDTYDEFGTPHPMVIAYHGYGASANSVGNQSTIDEEANARDMVYLSVTGLDDQLFGSPISQQNTHAAIQYMVDNFNVDPDRLYMVGFSAGAAISANFAARHRDPDGLMIAALGLVSCTGDWVLEYNLGDVNLKAWMQNAFNFGGPPSSELFAYQAASALYDEETSYPPVTSAIPVPAGSMVTNLAPVPTYLTYDTLDTIPHVPTLCDNIESMVQAAGGTVQKTVVTGTVLPGPPSVPAPHSWEVLDEVALFDFFDGKVVDRYPEDFDAQQDRETTVSWAEFTPERDDKFVYVEAEARPASSRLIVSKASNVEVIELDAGLAGLTGPLPYRVTFTNTSVGPARLVLGGFPESPSYLKTFGTNALVTLVDSDPIAGTLSLDVPGMTTMDFKVAHDPTWTTVLTTSPNPVAIGSPITVDIDGPAGDPAVWLVMGVLETFVPIESIQMTVFPGPPSFIRYLPLDIDGDLSLGQTVPNDPALEGLRFPTQVVTTDSGGALHSVSNHWGLYVAP